MITLFIAALAQETQTFSDPFDPYVAVQTELADSTVRQQGDLVADPYAWISTIRMRKTGHVQQYLKLEIAYRAAGASIGVDSAFYEGGEAADFQVIDKQADCSSDSRGCLITEVLSVRFPFQTATGTWRVQFRNRTGSWRGTVTIPDGIFEQHIARLNTLR